MNFKRSASQKTITLKFQIRPVLVGSRFLETLDVLEHGIWGLRFRVFSAGFRVPATRFQTDLICTKLIE